MASLDVFNQDAFSVTSLTAAVNELPHVPGQVGAAGLFEEDGVATTTVYVEHDEGDLALIEPTPRGGPGESVGRGRRAVRPFIVPHYQRDDFILADEVQSVRAFGTESEAETVMGKVEQRAALHTRAFDMTLEHQRVGAIKGIVTTKSGSTLVNLFTEFGISAAAAIDFDLDTTTTEVRAKCFDAIGSIEDDLEGGTYSHIHAFCGNDFWKALITHKSVKETYLNTTQAAELRGNMAAVYRFEFGGITFERYRTGKKATAANAAAPFIAANECRLVPVGVPQLFITRFAPADYEETVNTSGLPRYAKQWASPDNKGRHLQVQSNPISLCTRPKVLRRAIAVAE